MTSSARPRSSRSLALKGSRSSTASNGHEEQGEVEPAPKSGKRVIRLASRSAARKNSRDGVSSPSFTTKRSKKDNTITDEGKKSEEIVTEEDPKEEMKMYERWAEEYYEIVEQLPLELHRTYALIKELETKVQDRITFVASETQRYRDVRLKERGQAEESAAQISAMASSDIDVVHPDYGTSSDRDAEGEIIEEFYEQAQGMQKADMTDSIRSAAIKTISSSMPPPPRTPRAARLSILADIAKASTDAIRAAEEKLGLAVTAYDWVDRHIRRLDGDLQRSESSLLLGLRAGTEASRGVRDALGIGEGDNSYTHRRQSGLTSWEDEVLPSDQSTPVPTTSTDARKKSKLAKEMHMTSTLNQADVSASLMTDMAIDPNEPKYCYCDQVSSGDMVACDNEDCPREWFHYQCVGLTTPPKGKWYCLFCSPPGYKSSGTFPPDAPCLPPGYANKRSGDTANLGAAGKRGNKKKKKR